MDDIEWRIARIVGKVSIYEFFDWIEEPVSRRDRPHQIRCPFIYAHSRGDMSPSARIFPADDRMYCYTEVKSRDVLDAVQDFFGLTLPQAIRFIERKRGWKLSLARKLSQQIKSVLGYKPVVPKLKIDMPEQDIINIGRNLRGLMFGQDGAGLLLAITWIWDEYDRYYIKAAPMAMQVEWELWAKSILRYELRLLRKLRSYRPT